jgi:uncharacterized protein YbcI
MVKADNQDVHSDLAQALQEFWDEYAGIRPARVQVVSGEGAIIVWLEQVLSPAERQMASTQEGRKMMRKLEERILEQARPQLQQLVEGAVERKSILTELLLDFANGSVLAFFQLG